MVLGCKAVGLFDMRRIPTTVVIEKCLIVIDIGKTGLLLVIYCMSYLNV